jgi:hypothetical protein
VQPRFLRPRLDGPLDEGALAFLDDLLADGTLEVEDEAGADRLDDRRSAALLAVGGILDVAVFGVLT